MREFYEVRQRLPFRRLADPALRVPEWDRNIGIRDVSDPKNFIKADFLAFF